MRVVKSILKLLGGLIVCLIILLFCNYLRLIISYQIQKKDFKESFPVQGNQGKYVPQGMTFIEEENVVLQTSYNHNHTVSMLYVIDFDSGNLLKKLKLKEIDNQDNVNHVGGIASDGKRVWITNDFEVNEYSLYEIIHTKDNYIQSKKNTKLLNRGDFCTYSNGTLWIGDFYLDPFYPVKDNNPLLMGFDVVKDISYDKPTMIISLPKMVQGMVIQEDGTFLFTESFTNLIHSKLEVYRSVRNDQADTYKLNDTTIPYYHLDSNHLIKTVLLPPMAEGFFLQNGYYYILFENSSDAYFYAFPKLKNVIRVEQNKIDP